MRKKLTKSQYLIIYFLLYAFIGWLMETAYSFVILGHFTKRGFLFGSLCPIYGWGAVILIQFLGRYKKDSLKLFFYSAIIFSVFEYLVSFGLEALFSAHWWDYSNDFMNLNGRISIFYSFTWGIIAILFINHVQPFFEIKIKKLLRKTPYILQINALRILTFTVVVDTLVSSIKYLGII